MRSEAVVRSSAPKCSNLPSFQAYHEPTWFSSLHLYGLCNAYRISVHIYGNARSHHHMSYISFSSLPWQTRLDSCLRILVVLNDSLVVNHPHFRSVTQHQNAMLSSYVILAQLRFQPFCKKRCRNFINASLALPYSNAPADACLFASVVWVIPDYITRFTFSSKRSSRPLR